MKLRIVDVVLLVATIAGVSSAVSSARQLHGLQREDARLAGAIGDLVITDPTQLHVQAIDTGEPLHFAWRIYLPAGRMTASFFDSGGGKVGVNIDDRPKPRETIAHIRFTQHRPEQTGVYCVFNSGSGCCTQESPEIFQFLCDHWNELDIEQLGAQEVARLKSGESVTVLRVALPQSLIEKAREKNLYSRISRGSTPPFFECRLNWD